MDPQRTGASPKEIGQAAAGFPPCGGLRDTAKDRFDKVYPAGMISTGSTYQLSAPHRLPFDKLRAPPFDKLPRKNRGLCRDRSTTSRFFPGTERPYHPESLTGHGPRSVAEWEDGVQAQLASKGTSIQASLASPAAAATPYVTLRGCYAKPFRWAF